MSYVKTGLGMMIDRGVQSASTQIESAVTDDVAKAKAEQAAFLASLPRCTVNGQPSALYLYTYKNGVRACVRDPLAERAKELGLGTGPTVRNSMPLFGSGSSTIPGIRDGYLNALLGAQGSSSGRDAADSLGVQWDLTVWGFKDPWNPKNPPAKLSSSDFLSGRLAMRSDLQKASLGEDFIRAAKSDPQKEQVIRMSLAVSAHNFAAFTVVEQRERKASGEGSREHRASFCDTLGLPAAYNNCCRNALQSGMGFEEYTELLGKNDPRVLTCFAEADANAKKRQLFIAAGAVGAIVLGAALLKPKKGKR